MWKIYSLLDGEWEFRDETKWILDWVCFIQEKIDWANLSVWRKYWETMVWSRNQDVSSGSFRWAVEYIRSHKGIKSLLDTLEGDVRLYGEWLVPHTITNYNSLSYKTFYLFDMEINGTKLPIEKVQEYSIDYKIDSPIIFAKLDCPDIESLNKYVGMSAIWPKGEWIVIKNDLFQDEWWNCNYAKIVSPEFKEDNWIVFGNHQKGDVEMKITNKYITLGRVKKIINKIEQQQDKDISKADIKQIIWRVQHDVITEEAWNISKEHTICFRKLKGIMWKKTARIAVDIIEGNEESVAFDES